MIKAWHELPKKLRLLGAACCFILGVILLGYLNLSSGRPNFAFWEVMNALMGSPEAEGRAAFLIVGTRLPRILVAILAGAGLGVAGYLMQGALRNPLADPGLLGVSQAAALAVAVAAIYPELLPGHFPRAVLCLIAGAGAGAVVLFAASNIRSTVRLILAGVVVSGLFAVLTTMVIFTAPYDRTTSGGLAGYLRYTAGSLIALYWDDFHSLWPWLLAGLIPSWFSTKAVNLLQLGDEMASGAGLNPGKARLVLLAIALLLVCPIIAVIGPLGFIALFSPHISRFIMADSSARPVMILSALCGAFLTVAADTAGRLLFFPVEVPAGVWTIVVITPVALALLSMRLRRAG
jgi:iron complex transport system permease protein